MTGDDVVAAGRPRSRRKWLLGATAVVAAGAGATAAWWLSRSPSVDTGGQEIDQFWQAVFATPNSGELKMATLLGKPLLVNFWATWCPPCIEELPLLDRFFQENRANGWQVLGLAIDQPTAVRAYLDKMPLRFPVGLAGFDGTELSRAMGNLKGSLPFTAVFASNGKLLYRKMGRVLPEDLQQWKALR